MGRLRNEGPEVTKDGDICPDERIVDISKLVGAIDRVQLLTQGYRTSAESRERRFICIFKLGLNADQMCVQPPHFHNKRISLTDRAGQDPFQIHQTHPCISLEFAQLRFCQLSARILSEQSDP
jgi:hypothetical protein